MPTLAQQLQDQRLQKNLTQRELSTRANVAYSTLRRLESTGLGSISDVVKLLKALEMKTQLAVLGLDQQTSHQRPATLRRRARKLALGSTVTNVPISTPSESTRQATGIARKSALLDLSFPYDWSNPKLDDDVLIAKVLDKARFGDVSRTIAYFGIAQIEDVAQRFGISLHSGPLGAIMPAIRIAQAEYFRATPTETAESGAADFHVQT